MTTDGRGRSRPAVLLLVLGAAAAVGCMDAHASRRGDSVVVTGYPPDIQAAYEVFALRCSRCHTLALALNAHITDPEHWVRYVARMRRTPGSGINQQDGATILRFLTFYMHEGSTP